ncbi:hypothetical protein [Geotalea toluenoxydans]|uniref:hypothetical protein n=1 Tax=Geotalea toluenoxydans TaxID=421624 RepID=UPI0006D1E8B2|nr:hypothetical protein [Geotalea toluenoxydans]
MATTYRDRLIADIDEVPKSKLPQLYAIVHTIKEQLLTTAPTGPGVGKRCLGSAKGHVWMADDFNAPLPDEIVDEFYK